MQLLVYDDGYVLGGRITKIQKKQKLIGPTAHGTVPTVRPPTVPNI
jgi:hypothetical protein